MTARRLGNAALLVAMIERRAGDGVVVHNKRSESFVVPCPFCGCASWVAFCGPAEELGPGHSRSQADDVFECLLCYASHTRRDAVGAHHWEAR